MQLQPNLEDAVTWAYRLMLGREPESAKIVADQIAGLQEHTVDEVRRRFAASAEYTRLEGAPEKTGPDFSAFHTRALHERERGFFLDSLGVRTRISFLPPVYADLSGRRAGDRGLEILPFAENVELKGMTKAARAAVGLFTIMELGAGWGPWVVMGAAMARNTGLDYRLIAVEGSEGHFDFLRTHMADNDIDESKCRLLHAVIGDVDGLARFPRLLDPSLDYGASLDRPEQGAGYEEVPSWRIDTLLRGEPVVDIIHCDIQGHEVVALGSSIDAINARVRRVVVGTHGRGIEEQLHQLFSANGWSLRGDMSCAMTSGTAPCLMADGAQFWVNTRAL